MDHVALKEVTQQLIASNNRSAELAAQVAALNDDVGRWMDLCRMLHLELNELRSETRREIFSLRQQREADKDRLMQQHQQQHEAHVPLHKTPRALMNNFPVGQYDSDDSSGEFAPIMPLEKEWERC